MPDQSNVSLLDQMIKGEISKLSPDMQSLFSEFQTMQPGEVALQKKELKKLKREKEFKELKPTQEELGKKQSDIDEKKIGEYAGKYKQQQEIVTGTYTDVGGKKILEYPEDLQGMAKKQSESLQDSIRLWYKWKDLKDRGYNVTLPELREYEKAEKQRKYIPLQQSIEQMRQRGFNEKTINLFSVNYIKLIENGEEPGTALQKAYRITKMVNPTDFIMGKQQAFK